jgi:glutamate carboxypeptidase
MHPLLARAETHREWLLAAVETLVRAESPSTDKAAVDRCGAELETLLLSIGARVTRIRQADRGDHLRAEFGPPATQKVPGTFPENVQSSISAGGQVLLLGHFDTVWPVGQLAAMPLRIEDGRLYGPGVFDMKASLAVAMLAVRLLTGPPNQLARRVVMLWTSDEEIGSGTSRPLIEEEARRSDAVLVLEPSLPGGAAKTSRKGCGDFELVVHGMSAHAGIDPGRGANAIHELAHQILEIQQLQDPARGVSVNVNVIAGGARTNVIADRARAAIDVRVPTMDEARRIEQAMQALTPRLSGTRLEVTGAVARPPLERSPGIAKLYEHARALAGALGHDLREGGTGGGSDGNFTAALGVPTLDGLGPQGEGAHALHEHVLVDDLPWRAAFVASLLSASDGVK